MRPATRRRPSVYLKSVTRYFIILSVSLLVLAFALSHAFAAISIPTASPTTQNFDAIGSAATATLPADFKVDRPSAVRTVGTYAAASTATTAAGGANLSSTASNGIYNFGSGTTTTGGSDRAIGFLSSGSATQSGNLYAQLVNNTGSGLASLDISYDVEKYRNGINPAGFRIQLFYSSDGSTWASAGNAFLTSFAADSGTNSGFANAPGATVPVSSTLTVAIPSNANFYLAWNYSVSSGSTTTNAQALAIDNISIKGTPAVNQNDPPSINAPANPITTVAQDSAPFNVSLTGSDDGGVYNWSATPGAGVSSVNVTGGQGTSNVTYTVTLQNGYSGTASFTALLSDNVNAPVSQAVNINVTSAPPNHVVISQIYGGGGNSGATYTNDYVELFNPTGTPFTLTGWTLQYGSATGTSWTNNQPLGGTIAPGEYYLVELASGGAVGQPLPVQPNIVGSINMSATAGKVALVSNGNPLSGGCPVGSDPDIVDFVGYGTTANCREGSANAPAPSNTTALFRLNNGNSDTNQNGNDFTAGAPNPRRTSPIVELGPWVASTDPTTNDTVIPHDGSITVNFSEAVDVDANWYNITCASTGAHNDATTAHTSDFKTYVITPNVNFQFGEQCSVTINHTAVHDQDTDDSAPGTDTLFDDYTWAFTVVAAGQAAPYPPSVHLTMGNPTNAVADVAQPDNYLMEKPTYALSYNRDKGTPNWVSWHLDSSWYGTLTRVDTFRPDPAVPSDWYRVQATDYFTTGFDRGHMTPNADRDNQNRIPINQETYLMSNMVPQAPDNNQGPWANLENYLRTLTDAGSELYIVSGPAGQGGSGSNGGVTNTIAGGHVTVPAYTWKVVLVLPSGSDDVSRVTAATRTIAVIMPNTQGIRTNNPNDWQTYLTTVDAVENLTGYDFFSNVPDAIENSIEAGTNGVNPPGTSNESFTTAEDNAVSFTLDAVSPDSNPTFTYTVGQPSHGTLTGTGANRTYTPASDFNGTDSFTFSVSDGHANSNTSTVTILVTEVNDPPTASADSKTTDEDTALTFPAGDLASNDSAGPSDEAGQTLTVTAVSATGDTHGTVALDAGQITYTPAADYNGPASFSYTVCDNGTTTGSPDSKCAPGTVNVAVNAVNDAPVARDDSATTDEDTSVNINVLANDTDVDGDGVTVTAITQGQHGSVTNNNGVLTYTPAANYNGTDSFTYTASDGNGGSATASVSVQVNPVNDAPVLSGVPGSVTIPELSQYSFSASASDVDGDSLTFSLVGAPTGASISPTGQFTWTPTEAQGGTGSPYSFKVRVSDGTVNVDSDVTLNVAEVNQMPALAPIGDKLVLLGGTLTFTASATDADLPAQHIAYSLTGSVPAGASIDASTGQFTWTPVPAQAGQVYTFTVRATDDGPGSLSAEETIHVSVGYTWTGFLPPVNADGNSIFKLGRTVSVKFALTGASAGITNAVARLYVSKFTDNVLGTEEQAESTSAATTGNLFRYSDGQYIFNLNTDGLTAGTYQLSVDMGDGVPRVVNISLR